MMWTSAVIFTCLLALTVASSGMRIENEGTPCELQDNENLECNLWQMLTGKKTSDFPRLGENVYGLNKAPLFLCKGPGCIMTFIKKSVENSKRTGETDKKETTFYSGW